MWKSLKQLDQILRGEATQLSDLREGTIAVSVRGLAISVMVLGVIYGACMGTYAAFRVEGPSLEQLLASSLKVPALFLLTLMVTFPSLYVFNALVGSQLRILSTLRLLIAALGVNLAVLASLGPIVAFFSACTTSYPFMVLLNVFVFAMSGLLGLTFLLQTLHRITVARTPITEPESISLERVEPVAEPTDDASGEPSDADASSGEEPPSPAAKLKSIASVKPATRPGPLDRLEGHVLGRHVHTVFRCWVVVFGLVGAQMAWVLRPFIGDPNLPFTWFRARESNFFEAVVRSIEQLVGW